MAFCYSSPIKLLTALLKADTMNYSEELTNENVTGLSHQRAHRPSESQMKSQQYQLVTARGTCPNHAAPNVTILFLYAQHHILIDTLWLAGTANHWETKLQESKSKVGTFKDFPGTMDESLMDEVFAPICAGVETCVLVRSGVVPLTWCQWS